MTTTDQVRHDVLEACQALAAYGFGAMIGGHVSARVPGEELYATTVLDKTLSELTFDDIVLMDFDDRVVGDSRVISPGIDFHSGIYKLRPDVNGIVHTHGYAITAQSAFGRPPRVFHNLASYFFGRTAVVPDDSIASIAKSLGDDDIAIIIPWHGSITVGADLGTAVALHHTLDYAARLDIDMSAAGAEPMPDDMVLRVRALVEKADYLELTWQMMRRAAPRAKVPA